MNRTLFVFEPWALALLALAVRLALVDRQGLWVDEAFSLAMATGHSLEHHPRHADPGFGDFIESDHPIPARELRAFLEHEDPPASAARVLRAVRLSDTSPPLYYLALNGWSRAFGTGDRALKLFSVFASIASVPLLWSLGAWTGGRTVARIAVSLFAVSPIAVHVATDGRMYSFLIFLTLAQALLTIALRRSGGRWAETAAWVSTAAAGLLTHAFFAFAWLAFVAWLAISYPRLRRRVAFASLAVLSIALPWYFDAHEIATQWRVTSGQHDGLPPLRDILLAPSRLTWRHLSGQGVWGLTPRAELVTAGVVVVAGVAFLRALVRNPSHPLLLLVGWLATCSLGPLAFDFVLGAHSMLIYRYSLAGLPAAILILAFGLSRLPDRVRMAAFVVLIAAWMPGLRLAYVQFDRNYSPFREFARRLNPEFRAGDVVLVDSIPSGVLGFARYLPDSVPVASWVPRLGRRIPQDLERLIDGRRRLFLFVTYWSESPAALKTWLDRHARRIRHVEIDHCRLFVYEPTDTKEPSFRSPIAERAHEDSA